MKGQRWAAEWRERKDRKTGVTLRQLTNYKGHSHHLYFTNPGWYDDGRRLLFGSDRDNRTNLFSLDLETGEIQQMTDLDQPPPPAESSFLNSCVNPVKAEVYFWHGPEMVALDLHTLEERILYRAPERFLVSVINVTADGKYLCTSIFEDLSDRFDVDLLHGYVGFEQYHDAHPRSQLLRIATDGSGGGPVLEENYWIGHVNTSPTRPDLLSFCHEGPWHRVDNRIWGMNLQTGDIWKIRPTEAGDAVGHEYWLADGETIGYHGHIGKKSMFGFVRYDNTGLEEAVMPADSMHYHSNDRETIVGDGSRARPYVLLWRRRNGVIDEPRILCRHDCSMHMQQTHVHPRISPEGRTVLFTSDSTGYGNVYQATIPDIETLPVLE